MVLSKEQLGQRIKKARKYKSLNCGEKYTQSMLAKDIGISRSYLGDIEGGRKYPNYLILSRLAEVCGVPLNVFDIENYEDAFKKLRRINNIQLEQLSTNTNIPIEHLMKIENGEEVSLSVDQWLAIGIEFHLTAEEIFKIIFSDALYKSCLRVSEEKSSDLNSSTNLIQKLNAFMLPVYTANEDLSDHGHCDNEFYPIDTHFLTTCGYAKEKLFFLRVPGDSMEPTLLEGELALVHRQSDIGPHEIAVINIYDEGTKIRRVIISKGMIIAYGDNKKHPPQAFDFNECAIVGQVLKRVGDIK